jgi:hypothetical protein
VFAEMHRGGGARALAPFGQIVTELHFSTSLRFDRTKAREFAPLWTELVVSNDLRVFSNRSNEGYEQDRLLDIELVAAGLQDGVCCRELSLISSVALREAHANAFRGTAPGPQCDRKCHAARRVVARAGNTSRTPPPWSTTYLSKLARSVLVH